MLRNGFVGLLASLGSGFSQTKPLEAEVFGLLYVWLGYAGSG
ncbi:hypothetical protein HHE02_03460 [Helicobacter heilmannii]|uniref:Uncharacterized protein n=1 Tax=Helicobacter heilmannii TaxID=35817 RepID=A0A0K2XRP7_HELHE|nr:hypothetical protein BN341_40 [Helicobacter heilmannii ASB1.4]CRF46437.1 hypothetical protein HHE014_14450 [Helicobacter heilmannii]CRF47061.1 hypothetical protein HHE02_03460 [Helicobacter heilmannii]CRF49786.1 hypothetical protein HHE03_14540 [Helicobacter heilmannii]CRF50617.1 hypothetical protein HHE06_04570 [Helicobacter heilmannii]